MKNISSKFTLKALFLVFVFVFSFALQSCIHSPQQAWTPTKRKNMRDKKPRSPKYEKRVRTVKAL